MVLEPSVLCLSVGWRRLNGSMVPDSCLYLTAGIGLRESGGRREHVGRVHGKGTPGVGAVREGASLYQ